MPNPDDHYVYAVYRTGTHDPFYIGKGQDDRLDHHEKLARAGRRMPCAVRIRKIWAEGGSIEAVKLIDGLSETVAYEIEAVLIRLIGKEPLGPLVNLANGGEWGLTTDAIERRTAPRRGKKRPPEVCAKISASKMGHPVSAETRVKLREVTLAQRRLPNSPLDRTGKKQTEASLKKIRDALAALKRHNKICGWCEVQYLGRADQLWCSPRCRVAACKGRTGKNARTRRHRTSTQRPVAQTVADRNPSGD